jgi:proteasome assembly chaperone (PAC2) family protein
VVAAFGVELMALTVAMQPTQREHVHDPLRCVLKPTTDRVQHGAMASASSLVTRYGAKMAPQPHGSPSDRPNGGEHEGTRPTDLEHVRWRHRPDVVRPVLVTAFEGWNDAGDAASTAVRQLGQHWATEPFASIDPEVFYDFTSTRPQVRLDLAGERHIDWPDNELGAARVSDDLHVVTLVGNEPQLRWRTFCSQITGLARLLDVRMVVTMGALLSEVPHTRPTPVYGAAYDAELTARLGLMPSRYEGPTGIVGVLHAAFTNAGLPSASLWAAVPTYVPSAPSPKAALALVERAARLLEVEVDTGGLQAETRLYEEQISQLVDADEESRDYVAQLEASYDDGEAVEDGGFRLIAEVEKFLRDQ